jgi:hypothetical protein
MIFHISKLASYFFNSHMKRKKMILCNCELTSDFSTHTTFLKKMIFHTCKFTNGFSSTHAHDKTKWYFPLVDSWMVFFSVHINDEA